MRIQAACDGGGHGALCGTHYARRQRHGDPLYVGKRGRKPSQATVDARLRMIREEIAALEADAAQLGAPDES